MNAEISNLVASLTQARLYLAQHGERHASGRLSELETRLARDDTSAVVSAVSEASGGMGSLNDVVLGHTFLDARLRALVADVERDARLAAHCLGIHLGR